MVSSESQKKAQENRILKIGYFSNLTERYPFNSDPNSCSTPDSAYFLTLEQMYMEIPTELEFDTLLADEAIEAVHRERILKVWNKVQETRNVWIETCQALTEQWARAPGTNDKSAKETFNSTPNTIRHELKMATIALISDKNSGPKHFLPRAFRPKQIQMPFGMELQPLQKWKKAEKALRMDLYNADKNYLAAYRCYLDLLLEMPPENTDEYKKKYPEIARHVDTPPVITGGPENPLRLEIRDHVRHLRLIDVTHQAVAIAKAAHHQQEHGRLRMTEAVPYSNHVIGVIGSIITDEVVEVMDEDHLSLDIILAVVLGGIHDLYEDTDLGTKDLVNGFLKPHTDRYDSTFEAAITSGFGRDLTEMKKRHFDLIKGGTQNRIVTGLEVVSKNSKMVEKLNRDQRWRAISANPLGLPDTLKHLGEMTLDAAKKIRKEIRTYLIKKGGNKSQAVQMTKVSFAPEVIAQFPDISQYQIDEFLVKTSAVEASTQHATLIVKMLDRENNLATSRKMSMSSRRKNLRGAFRLIAWCLFHYPNTTESTKHPIHNSVTHLLNTAVRTYAELLTALPDLENMEVKKRKEADKNTGIPTTFNETVTRTNYAIERKKDVQLYETLRKWSGENPIKRKPKVQRVLDEWKEANPDKGKD